MLLNTISHLLQYYGIQSDSYSKNAYLSYSVHLEGGKKRTKNWKRAFFCLSGDDMKVFPDESLVGDPLLQICLGGGSVKWETELTRKDNALLVCGVLYVPGVSSELFC